MTVAPHCARRWFLVAYRIAIRIRTTSSVDSQSALLALGVPPEEMVPLWLHVRKERVRLRTEVMMMVR